MTDNATSALFQSLGYTGRDVRQVVVQVYPSVHLANGVVIAGHKAYIGEAAGNFRTTVETDFIFASADPDWEFMEFELGGQTWPGLAIFPGDGDFTVRFGDTGPRSVLLTDRCACLYTHRYQIVLKNKVTGEIALCDPEVGNGGDGVG